MIFLRELRESDAVDMLEWMHDQDIQKGFNKNMLSVTLEDAKKFCRDSSIPAELKDGANIHWAIVDEQDEYLGTISLKSIDVINKNAEYAISTRKKVHGKGVALSATKQVLTKAFKEYGLHRVYLNVLSDNEAAIHLYKKAGFKLEGEFRDHLMKNDKYLNWKWFGILESEFCEYDGE